MNNRIERNENIVLSRHVYRFGHVFAADAGNSVGEISGMTKPINSVDFKSTRPFRAITGSEDNAVSFFEGPPFKWKTTIAAHDKFVHVVRYAPDGEKFASGSADGRVCWMREKEKKAYESID